MDVLRRSKAAMLACTIAAALLLDVATGPMPIWAQGTDTTSSDGKAASVRPAKKPVRKKPAQAEATDTASSDGKAASVRPAKKPVRKKPVQAQATDTTSFEGKPALVRPSMKSGRKKPIQAAQPAKKPAVPTRPEFSDEEQQRAQIPGFSGVRFWGSSAEAYEREVPPIRGPWLVLSSGGEDGAYGAGFLNGWTAAGNRPEFPVVTGISTGALMAVYAFAGPKYDTVLRDSYTGITAADIFEVNPTPESLVDTWPLKRLIEKNVTADVLADVAAEYKRGRRLFVLTTNLDAGRSVVWDMGAIAAKGSEQALSLFRDILLASASIPGAFPPVYIEAEADGRRFMEMHVDGGVNGPMYIAPESYLFPGSTRHLPMSQLYVILNGKVTTEFSAPQRATAAILGRSISLALQMGARMDLVLFYQAALRDRIDFNLALVESGFDNKARGAFDSNYMKALFDRGFEQGKKNQFLKELPFRKTTAVSEGAGGPAQK